MRQKSHIIVCSASSFGILLDFFHHSEIIIRISLNFNIHNLKPYAMDTGKWLKERANHPYCRRAYGWCSYMQTVSLCQVSLLPIFDTVTQ